MTRRMEMRLSRLPLTRTIASLRRRRRKRRPWTARMRRMHRAPSWLDRPRFSRASEPTRPRRSCLTTRRRTSPTLLKPSSQPSRAQTMRTLRTRRSPLSQLSPLSRPPSPPIPPSPPSLSRCQEPAFPSVLLLRQWRSPRPSGASRCRHRLPKPQWRTLPRHRPTSLRRPCCRRRRRRRRRHRLRLLTLRTQRVLIKHSAFFCG